MTLRVLSLTTLFPKPGKPGNFGGFVERQFKALAQRGDVELTVICPIAIAPWPLDAVLNNAAETGAPGQEDWRGYPVHYPRYTYVPKFGARWNDALLARCSLPLASKLHDEKPFDLIDAQFFYPDGPAAAQVARALNLPLSIKARGSDIHYWGKRQFARRKIIAAAEQSAGILAVSEALKTDMLELGMQADRIAVHYTGLDHAIFRPQNRRAARKQMAAWDPEGEITPVPTDGKLLVSTGNLIPLKGQALAIEALPNLPDVRLLIAGGGPEHANLQKRAASLGLSDRVHFGAYSPEDLAVALAGADAMVLPSENEGLANAWIEALACGTPLVITDVGGAREVVRDPSAGRLVERSPEAIATGIRDLLANPPSQAEVAVHAARFSWEANATQLAEHYALVAGFTPSRASRS